ncbi:hypothetical protein DSO57_1000437 [Entomophthora muscae]|uniref:Uncharacterized protein n=1 Tax=Entomophthora muscae TaxID=34485 RepID=A0ACC2UI93_9FUNG|nr:hypothetical protein DSO57_1000437 [Entomophthora muscae]
MYVMSPQSAKDISLIAKQLVVASDNGGAAVGLDGGNKLLLINKLAANASSKARMAVNPLGVDGSCLESQRSCPTNCQEVVLNILTELLVAPSSLDNNC